MSCIGRTSYKKSFKAIVIVSWQIIIVNKHFTQFRIISLINLCRWINHVSKFQCLMLLITLIYIKMSYQLRHPLLLHICMQLTGFLNFAHKMSYTRIKIWGLQQSCSTFECRFSISGFIAIGEFYLQEMLNFLSVIFGDVIAENYGQEI